MLKVKQNVALLRYLKPTDELPVPKGSLSSSMEPQAIAWANEEVREAMKSVSRKHGPYWVYSADIQAKIDKYASHYGIAVLLQPCIFSRKLEKPLSKTPVHSIQNIWG